MGLLDRWDRRNQRTLQEHNEVTWDELAREPQNPILRTYLRARLVGTVVACFLGLFALVAWMVRGIVS